jgi:hypothetical protein
VHFATTILDAENLRPHEDQFLKDDQGSDTGPLVTGLFSASRPSLSAGAGSDGIQLSTSVGAPTLETLQVGLEDMLDRLKPDPCAARASRADFGHRSAPVAVGAQNPNRSVARVFGQEQAIRLQTRRQIASMLSPKQTQKVAELMTRRAEKLENRANDH